MDWPIVEDMSGCSACIRANKGQKMFQRIINALTPETIRAARAERAAWAVLHTIERERQQAGNGRHAA